MNRYQLKVSPDRQWRRIWRMIEICGCETLDELCSVILTAFDFSHDHMYEFCMTNRMYSRGNYTAAPEGPGQPSTRTKIDALGLTEGKIFSLHYDFGDDWIFAIRVMSITDAPRAKPAVTGAAGHVEQYPDSFEYEFDDEEYDDESEDDDDQADDDEPGDDDDREDDDEPEDDDSEEEEDKELSDLLQANQEYLKLFEKDLRAAGLAEKTIESHVNNASYYINVYILRHSEGMTMVDGIAQSSLIEFFGDFYIHVCRGSTPNYVKTTAVSVKKFYRCMMEHGYVDPDAYQDLCELFKSSMAEWQEACREKIEPAPDLRSFFRLLFDTDP